MSDAYSFRPGGSLKLKGDKDKKKKKKVPTEEDHSALRDEIERSARAADVAERSTRERDESPVSAPGSPAAGSSRATPTTGTSAGGRKKTAAEEKYDKIQEDRRRERARKKALMTHKDRVANFNASLDRLSEHHDMPRIGPG